MEERIKFVMASVFGIEASIINENSSPITIPNWDSLLQINLIIALEEEFEIELSDDEIPNLLSYKTILKSIQSHFD